MKLVYDAEFEHDGVRIWRTLEPEIGFVVEGYAPLVFWPSYMRAELATELVALEQREVVYTAPPGS